MFDIFRKKVKLQSVLYGMTDIHNHILPGIDDGAKTIEESIDLVKDYIGMGITKFYVTPHTMSDYYPNTKDTIHKSFEQLSKALIERGMDGQVDIKVASEYMLDYDFESLLEKNELLTMNQNYVLIEMSCLHKFDRLNEVIYEMQNKGYKPILAHPERYLYYVKDKNIFKELKQRGIALQLNALSLTDHYGSHIKEKASELLKEGSYDFIGLDTHKKGHINLLSQAKVSANFEKPIQQLVQNNLKLF